MSIGTLFVLIVAAGIAGACFLGFGVFLYFQYRAIQRMTEACEALYAIVKPLAEGTLAKEVLHTFQASTKVGKDLVPALHGIQKVVMAFTKAAFNQQAAGAVAGAEATGGFADEGDSGYSAPNDEKMAEREAAEFSAKAGYPVDTLDMPEEEPNLSTMRGDNV